MRRGRSASKTSVASIRPRRDRAVGRDMSRRIDAGRLSVHASNRRAGRGLRGPPRGQPIARQTYRDEVELVLVSTRDRIDVTCVPGVAEHAHTVAGPESALAIAAAL